MSALGRVAVTGARGRLGRALVAALQDTVAESIAWSRPDYDLDDPGAAERLVTRDRPDLVIHAAAWSDVDGCARDPELAMRRNALAVGEIARACRSVDADLVLVSTNGVFDGRRIAQRGYREDDPTQPINPYGASKLAGEKAATEAFRNGGRLWIVRTAWLHGPPGNDFPAKILAAADRLPPGEPLPVVADEIGSPTYAPDLADAIVSLASQAPAGVYHLVNAGRASRMQWAAAVLQRLRPGRPVRAIDRAAFQRTSTAPAWAVLESGRAARRGLSLRAWPAALEAYLAGGSLV